MSKGIRKFTAEELAELKAYDAVVDLTGMTEEDYETSRMIDRILFPEKEVVRERNRRYYHKVKTEMEKAGRGEELKAKRRATYEKRKEADKVRKAQWYAENRERIRAQQKAYRERKKLEAAVA